MNRKLISCLAGALAACAGPKPFDPASIECQVPATDQSATHPHAAGYQAALEHLQTTAGLPGAVLGIRDQDGTWFGATGFADLESRTPMKTCHRTRAMSISKTFTAATVLKLADEGKLSLDDTIGRWLPANVARSLTYVDDITVRHLLQHTSGLQDPTAIEFNVLNAPYQRMSREECVAAMTTVSSDQARPGRYFRYANPTIALLGLYVIPGASGTSTNAAMREAIMGPLDLAATSFADSPEEAPVGVVPAYGDFLNDGAIVRMDDYFRHWSSFCRPASGGVVTNAYDLMHFIDALARDKTLVSAASTEAMLQNSGQAGLFYGMGVDIQKSAHGVLLGHSGHAAWSYRTFAYYLPAKELTVVLWYNTGPSAGILDEREAALYWGFFEQLLDVLLDDTNL